MKIKILNYFNYKVKRYITENQKKIFGERDLRLIHLFIMYLVQRENSKDCCAMN